MATAEKPATLAETWFHMPGMCDRGACGRLIVGPTSLRREDLDFNYDVIGQTILWVGVRPCIEPLTDAVEDFFHMTRPRGKPPASRHLDALACIPCCVLTKLSSRLSAAMVLPEVTSARPQHGESET